MTVNELSALGENGATIVNVGRHAGKREIRGAIRYRPDDLLAAERLMLPIAPDKPVVLYDESGDTERTQEIAEKLRAEHFVVACSRAALQRGRTPAVPFRKRRWNKSSRRRGPTKYSGSIAGSSRRTRGSSGDGAAARRCFVTNFIVVRRRRQPRPPRC